MNLLEKALFYFQNQLPFVLYAKPDDVVLQGVFPGSIQRKARLEAGIYNG